MFWNSGIANNILCGLKRLIYQDLMSLLYDSKNNNNDWESNPQDPQLYK